MWQFLDSCISPLFLIFGIFGNLFMLSIVLRWITKYHMNINFCTFQCQLGARKINSSGPKINAKFAVERSSILNLPMCIYLAFLSIADIGFLVTATIRNGLRAANSSDKYLLPLDISNAFKGASQNENPYSGCIHIYSMAFPYNIQPLQFMFFHQVRRI